MKGKMPIQAKANGLSLDKVPQELYDLNSLELHLISMHIPFMKMISSALESELLVYAR